MDGSVPELFAPVILRNRLVYRDLSRHSLTIDQKTFIGSEAAKISSFLSWPNEIFTTARRITDRYKLPDTSVRDWMKKVASSIPITNKRGRPFAMDEEAIEKFQKILEMRRAAKNAVPLTETLSLMNAGVSDTHMRLGKRGAAAVSNICVTTQKRLFQELKVVKVKAQVLTDARLKALRCPRLSYIWGCVCMAYSACLRGEHKWNADATTIVVSESGNGALVCIIKDKENKEPVASLSLPNNLNLLIKWFALNNAGGEAGPLVLMITVPTMEENTFFATQVLSMGSTTAIGEKGWLYFSKTRGGCSSIQDGEAKILIPAMCEEVQEAFKEANTDFIKGPPSATAKHQPNDVNASFRDTKKVVASVTRNETNVSNPTLAAHVRKAVHLRTFIRVR